MKTLVDPLPEKPLFQRLLQWRWLVLVASLVIVLLELYEGHDIRDLDLWREILLYAVGLPSVIWLLLTILAHAIAQQAKVQESFEHHRHITEQLSLHREWDELTQFVTWFPNLILPVDHTAFFTYDHRSARLEFVTRWDSSSSTPPSLGSSQSYNICQTCLLARPPRMHSAAACAFAFGPAGDKSSDEFCLPLSYNNVLVGLLRLRCRPGIMLTRDQVEFMEAMSPKIALALAFSISYPKEIAQVRREAGLDVRYQIAYELHNSLAQQIGYLHLSLDRLASDERLLRGDEVQDELEHLRVVAGDAYEQIRNTLTRLRSGQLVNLPQAIADHTRLMAQITKLQIDFTSEGEAYPLPAELGQRLFDLVREGLNNVDNHACAQHAQVRLIWSADSLHMSVVDEGVGFDPTLSPPQGHYGLVMMKELVEASGGEFTLASSPGEGTRLNFRIPIHRFPANPEAKPALANLPAPT